MAAPPGPTTRRHRVGEDCGWRVSVLDITRSVAGRCGRAGSRPRAPNLPWPGVRHTLAQEKTKRTIRRKGGKPECPLGLKNAPLPTRCFLLACEFPLRHEASRLNTMIQQSGHICRTCRLVRTPGGFQGTWIARQGGYGTAKRRNKRHTGKAKSGNADRFDYNERARQGVNTIRLVPLGSL